MTKVLNVMNNVNRTLNQDVSSVLIAFKCRNRSRPKMAFETDENRKCSVETSWFSFFCERCLLRLVLHSLSGQLNFFLPIPDCKKVFSQLQSYLASIYRWAVLFFQAEYVIQLWNEDKMVFCSKFETILCKVVLHMALLINQQVLISCASLVKNVNLYNVLGLNPPQSTRTGSRQLVAA